MIELYPHQLRLNEACRASMLQGNKAVLIQSATGSGKSVMSAAQIYSSQQKQKRAAFVVPRKQLLDQMAKTFDHFGINYSFVASGRSFNPYARVHICSAQTLVNRLDDINPDVLFVDEAHIGSTGLDKLINHYKNKGAYVILLSATPQRLDGRGLKMWADDMVCGESIKWLIANGFLSDYKLFAPSTPNFDKIRIIKGEYAKGQLADMMEKDNVIIGDAVKYYRQHAIGRLHIAFCTSVKHSKLTAERFMSAGIPAAHMDGDTPTKERREIIRAFARREILVLSNVEILTTGFDLSSAADMDVCVESMSDLRPTKSLALQLQKWGRVLRKKDQPALIFDHVNNWKEHDLPDDERVWTLEDRATNKNGAGERAEPVKQCGQCFFCHKPAPVCPNCGHIYEVKSRMIDEADGELFEISREEIARTAEIAKKKKEAADLAKLTNVGRKRGQKNPELWARNIMKAQKQMKNWKEPK